MTEKISKQPKASKAYWAFISYSSKDAKWGKWLHRRLENYAIPAEFRGLELSDGTQLGKNLRPVFRDRDELAGSAELGPAIEAALKESRFLIVLCSPNAAQSKWVNKEIEDFRSISDDGKVLALIVDGEPNASSNPNVDDSLECFPPALRYPMEPLAGDLRTEGDGKERGFLKILSGIADIGFDKLYRRHERVQRKRRLIWATAASVLIAALASLSVFALNQKSIAEKQTEVAVAQTKKANEKTIIADQQTKIAEQQTIKANDKTKLAEQQKKLAQTQTKEAEKQKALAESNAQETSRKLAQHYQYRANELLISENPTQKADNAMRATVLLTEAMRVSKPFRESAVERLKLQTLLNDKQIPDQLFHHPTAQSFSATHQHIVLTCGEDHTVQLWDSLRDQQIGKALRFDQPLSNAVFSTDGKFVAVFDAKYTWVIDCGSGAIVSMPLEIDASYQYGDKHKFSLNRPETSQVVFIDSKRIAVMNPTALKVFDFTSGEVVASIAKPKALVFRNLIVLDDQHLWIDLRTDAGGIGIPQNKQLVVSLTDGSVVHEPAKNISCLIAARAGTALVFEDDVIYLHRLVDNKRLLEFPRKSRGFVERTLSPKANVFLAWHKDGDKSHIYMADVAGQKITVPPLAPTQIFEMFLLDDQHMLVAYHASRKTKRQRGLEVWNFRNGQLKASAPVADFPNLCCTNSKSDKVIFSAGKQIFFWDFQKGIHRLSGNHLNNITHLEFVDHETCLSSDDGLVKKWKFPAPEALQKNITWAHGKFDAGPSGIVFGEDLLAFTSTENERCYVSIYDEKQQRLVADSIHIPEAKKFHWTPLRFSINSDFLLAPYWADGNKKRCFIWDTKLQQPAKLDLPVPIRQVVRIDDSEIAFLGDDDQLHFHSLTNAEHETLKLGPLRDGKIQWSPDRRCIVVEGKETAFIVDLKTRSVVFDKFFIWPPNEACWLADEQAVWCVAGKQLCKLNWLTGEVLAERQHQDSVDGLTCLADKNMLISTGSDFDGRIRSGTSLKFWDLAGNDLGIEVPINDKLDKREFYRSADDEFVHVPGIDSFTTVSTTDRKTTVHSDSFLRENLKTAKIYTGENRKHMVIWPRNGKYRVYDTSTLSPVSKPFSVGKRDVISSSSFDTFRMGGEIMTLSNREKINFYQTTTGYKINSILAGDYVGAERGLERNYRVLKGARPNQLVLVNKKKNEMALVEMALGDLTYQNASLKNTVVSEQRVDSTNAVVPVPKKDVIQALKELQKLGQRN